MENEKNSVSREELEISFLADLRRMHYLNRGKNLKNYLERMVGEKVDKRKTIFSPEEDTLLITDKKYFDRLFEVFGPKKIENNYLPYEIVVPETNSFEEDKITIKYGFWRRNENEIK